MSHSKPSTSDLRISEEAALWLIEFDAGTADHAAFAAWLEASPRHVEEFLLASALWQASEGIDRRGAIDVEQLVQEASRNVHPLDDAASRAAFSLPRPRPAKRRWVQVAAALAMIAAGVALWAGFALQAPQYVTGVGEQRVLKLPDGSIVTLNTRSRVTVRFNDSERRIELAEGEAHFDVQPDATRPFRVISGGAAVQAIGTQFNVRRADLGTTVAVVAGIVQVAPRDAIHSQSAAELSAELAPGARLTAGEQAQLSANGEVLRKGSAEIDRITAWRSRRLVFRDEPLQDIAAEFNRYNVTQLVVEGSHTRTRRMTGVFDADDLSALVAFLERDAAVVVEARDKSIVIRGP